MGWNFNENENKDFGPRLEPGPRQAVVFAVYDMGQQESTYKGTTKVQHKIRLGIELNELYTEGKFVGSRITKYPKFTLSFYENANLATAVRGILGRDMTDDEIKEGGEVLIGKNFQLSVTYGKNQDGTESKYPDFMYSPLMKGIEWIKPVLTPDYLPDFITKERQEKTVKQDVPPVAQKVAEKFQANDPDGGFANGEELDRQRMLAEIQAWRNDGTLTMSKLIATTKLQTGKVINQTEALQGLTLAEVLKVYNGVK